MSQQQQRQHLPGAVILLAFSIITLAAVLAGIERDRSRRQARGCRSCAQCTTSTSNDALCQCADEPAVTQRTHEEETCSRSRSPAIAAAGAGGVGGGLTSNTGSSGGGKGPQENVKVAVSAPSAGAGGGVEPAGPEGQGRRLEILVHNVSHKDMVLSLRRTRRAAQTHQQQQQQRRRRRPAGEAVCSVIDAVDTALARPKFSLFKPSSELILDKLNEIRAAGGREPPPAVCPVSRRGEPGSRSDPSSDPRESVSVGFDLDDIPIPISDLGGYRVRSEDLDRLVSAGRENASGLHGGMHRRDSSGLFMAGRGGCRSGSSNRLRPLHDPGRAQHLLQQPKGSENGRRGGGGGGGGGGRVGLGVGTNAADEGAEAFISGVFFPLLSVLMPAWMELLAGNGDDVDSSKTVLLVSGVGQPRNEEHRLEDNSTEVTAMLMEVFLKRHYPAVRVVRVHSDTNIFRYDDNIRFVKTELLPLLNAERSRTAEKYGADWQDMMHITMSFADGSPARISSINTALRHFRPSFVHIWELKTFWHEKVICEDDVEVHTFEDIDMQPPIPASEVDAPTALIIAEMLRLRDDLEEILASPPLGDVIGGDARDDLASFWLRKTKRPVLAVLLVQKKGSEPRLYRGTNMEVSLPTGSLCAERNAIGSALTADLSLLRRDIKAVAVLSVAPVSRPSSSAATTAVTAAGIAGPSAAVGGGGGGGGRSGQGAGVGLGLGSVEMSLVGSSVASCVPSPSVLTPATKPSPKRVLVGAREGEGQYGGTEDEKRLEGVRRALFAVAAESSAPAPVPAAATTVAAGGGGGRGGGGGGAPPVPRETPDSLMQSSDVANTSGSNSSMSMSSANVVDSRGPSQQQQQSPQVSPPLQGQREIAPGRVIPRFRSESCADELLAAGRNTTEEAFGSSCGSGGGGGGNGGGEASSSPAAGREGAAAGGEPDGRSHVSRSQSLDLGTAEVEGQKGRDPLGKEQELPRRKVTEKWTKIVRSLASTPSRGGGGGGSGSILGGGGGGGGGGGRGGSSGGGQMYSSSSNGGSNGSNIFETYNDNDKSNSSSDKNKTQMSRSSIVAHVPAETLCSNPLKPCGACMEWLKKIAEVNPDFKVITFTDSRCGGVYIEDVAQILL
ncbi:unnamed protein product [Pylaiella littoralis]